MEKREEKRGSRGGSSRSRAPRQDKEFDQKVIDLARVTRVVAGGKRMRFRACVVIGNNKGKIGMAIAKGADVTSAVNKAVNQAKKRMIIVPIVQETIPHDINLKFKSAHVMLKPAPKGSGVIAGGAVRAVMSLAGITNVVCKMMGSQNKINNVKAVFVALSRFKTKPMHMRMQKSK